MRTAVLLAVSALAASPIAVHAQSPGLPARIELKAVPDSLNVGESVRLEATAYDSAGRVLADTLMFFSTERKVVHVERMSGQMQAAGPGRAQIIVISRATGGKVRATADIAVRRPPLASIALTDLPAKLYASTTVRARARLTDAAGLPRTDTPVTWSSSDRRIADVSQRGEVTAVKPGAATIRATAEGMTGNFKVTVAANPARTILLTATADSARTGDVVHFAAKALDAAGREVADYPIQYSLESQVEDTVIAHEAPAQVDEDGAFVAERAGLYTVVATGGNIVANRSVAIGHRFTSIRLATGKGQGPVRNVHTSDLWVWTGRDGRDYAITGTWGGEGKAYFWDVTDPATPTLTDSIQVDARTVNDVKVDEERGLCFITREGASNRKNGFLILDCSDPHHVSVVSTFDDGLYGGVHNIFYWNKHLFPINAGTRFDIINIEDPRTPRRVGTFELDTPDHGIHDVWVVDGIAYSSNWGDGVVMIDVGNGVAGGTPEKPVRIGQYTYPIGAAHSAFPYPSKSTGKFYVFVGDEQFPYGLGDDDPDEAAGYIHVVDFTDRANPKEVARYQVPEAGPHNFWIENDTLYVAYSNAGLRVVDISGELKGNLYSQGRELVRFKANDPQGKVANAPMAWGPQPHKGHVFFTDFNSGLWTVKLPERAPREMATP
jgi:hypothetical protein